MIEITYSMAMGIGYNIVISCTPARVATGRDHIM